MNQYLVQLFDQESGEWRTFLETNTSVRIISNKYVTKVVFETDDLEWNG